jgi:hypothetical protein
MSYSPATGEPMEDKNRPLTDMLGTDYCGPISDNVKKATWEDLMAAHGFVPPGGRKKNPTTLTSADLTTLKDAWVAKTGWTYTGMPANACCSCCP